MESNNSLVILHPSSPQNEVQLSVENALSLGYPVLLENFGETI
jgi:hypothetical protein